MVPPQAELWLLEALAGDAVERPRRMPGVRDARPRGRERGVPARARAPRRRGVAAAEPNGRPAPERARRRSPPLPAGRPISRGSRTTPRRRATRRRCCGSRRPRPRARPRSGRIARPPRSTRGRCASPATLPAGGSGGAARGACSHECFLTYQFDEAIEARQRALDCHRRAWRRAQGGRRRSLAVVLLWHIGSTAEADAAAREAVALLERLPPGRELASAYARLSQLRMKAEDAEAAAAWGTRAIELARATRRHRRDGPRAHHPGYGEFLARGGGESQEELERDPRARPARRGSTSRRDEPSPTSPGSPRGCACTRSPTAMWRRGSTTTASAASPSGRRICWRCAHAPSSIAGAGPRPSTPPAPSSTTAVRPMRSTARSRSSVLGLVRARRGDPGAWPPLDEALALVRADRRAPAARAGRRGAGRGALARGPARGDRAATRGRVRARAAAARGSGRSASSPAGAGAPASGSRSRPAPPSRTRSSSPATGSAPRSCGPRSAAPTRPPSRSADADDDGALRRALDELQRLGARPAAAIVARRLRERGARGLPRGPRPATTARTPPT